MRTIKHTPGPWIQGEDKINPELITAPSKNDGAYYYVADPWPLDDEEEYRANARLIAVAPDLLAACKDILTFLQHAGYDTALIKAAIAKAEGKEVE